MGEQKIVVYHHPNPEIKSFLTEEEISPPRVEYFRNPIGKESEISLERLGVIGSQIVKEIMQIPGVMEVRIKPKEIRMRKETISSWKQIEGKVLEILRRALRRKQLRVVRG